MEREKICAIGSQETVLGFKLLGIAGEAPESPEGLLQVLRRRYEEEGMALILLEEGVAELARESVEDYKARRGFPLIVELPGPEGPLKREGIKEFIAGAIGVRL
ncbi:MAG: V-type ATP synthase subunit F [Candidatus Bipolaricaulia bacterium]